MKSRYVYELDQTHRKICLRSVIPSSCLILVKAGRGSLSARPLTGKCEREPNHTNYTEILVCGIFSSVIICEDYDTIESRLRTRLAMTFCGNSLGV